MMIMAGSGNARSVMRSIRPVWAPGMVSEAIFLRDQIHVWSARWEDR